MADYDRPAFGGERRWVLAHLLGSCPEAAFLAETGRRIRGFVLARTGRTATHIGPLAADDADIAETLAARALAAVDGPVIVDVMVAKAGFTTWLEDAGFQARRTFTRMRLAGDRPPGEPHRTYLAAGPEFG